MKADRAPRRRALAGFAALNAVAAWAGAIGLLTGDIDFGDTLDDRLPFDNLALAGVSLAVIVAIPLSALSWSAWTGHRRTNELSLLVGIALIGWIVLQVLILRSLSLFQALYLGVGVYFVDSVTPRALEQGHPIDRADRGRRRRCWRSGSGCSPT